MTDRPEDVPAAMKAAFREHRVSSAWNMLAVSDDANRMAALRGFERLLAARGLRLEDVAEAVLALPDPAPARPASPFDGLFSSFMGADRPAQPSPDPVRAARTRKPHLSGADIPATVFGTIRIDDERTIQSGDMVFFTIETDEAHCGPIVAFAGAHLDRIKETAEKRGLIGLAVAQPKRQHRHPYVMRVLR